MGNGIFSANAPLPRFPRACASRAETHSYTTAGVWRRYTRSSASSCGTESAGLPPLLKSRIHHHLRRGMYNTPSEMPTRQQEQDRTAKPGKGKHRQICMLFIEQKHSPPPPSSHPMDVHWVQSATKARPLWTVLDELRCVQHVTHQRDVPARWV